MNPRLWPPRRYRHRRRGNRHRRRGSRHHRRHRNHHSLASLTALPPPPARSSGAPDASRGFTERPPHTVRWRTWTGTELTTIGFHADPDNVEHELDLLGGVAAEAAAAGELVLTLGDFNADCSYLGVNAWAGDASGARVVVLG